MEDIIPLLVCFQVPIGKLGRFDAQYPGYPVDVLVVENGADAAATVGAFKAVHFRKGLLMQLMNQLIKMKLFCLWFELF